MKYKILLFDLDNTLFDFNKAEDNALREFLKEENVENIQEFIDVYLPINRSLWKKLEEKKITREELVNTRFSKSFEVLGVKKDGKELAKKYQNIIGKQGICYEGAYEFLKKIENEFDIYAATNGITEIQKNRLKNSNIAQFFKKVYISEEIGFLKPHKEFFEYIENELKFDKKEVLMIGDNIIADIKGASDFGIDTIWFNKEKKENIQNIFTTYEVSNYEEILKILLENI